MASQDSSSFHIKTGPKQTDKFVADILFSFSFAAIFTECSFSPKRRFSVTYLDVVLSLSTIAGSCLVNLEQVVSNYRFVVPMSFVDV